MEDREVLVAPFRIFDNAQIGDCLGSNGWNSTLRKSLLYWPKVVLPIFVDGVWHNRKEIYQLAEVEYLSSLGQVDLLKYVTQPSDQSYVGTYKRVSNEYLKASLGRRRGIVFFAGNDNDSFMQNFLEHDIDRERSRVSIEVSLVDALPSPPLRASTQDIIEYKLKNIESFGLLHAQLDKISFLFGQAGELEEGVRLAKREIEPILLEINRRAIEKWPDRILTSFKQHLGNFSTNAVSGAVVGSLFGVPITGAVTGAAKGTIEAVVKSAIQIKSHTDRTKPFVYSFFSDRM